MHSTAGEWYRSNARDLPWRHTRDPYAILVSEIMLQQTQVERTIPKYREFLAAFPTLEALAAASPGDVIRVWSGMGYNGRAVRLHRLAQQVVNEHGGTLPSTIEALRRLPGIGPYTAAAVACFAFDAAVPVADTNIYRALSRIVHGVKAPQRKDIDPLVESFVPGPAAPISASDWHQALMDIGATLCTSARPRCMLCPFLSECNAAPHLQDGAAPLLAESSVPYVAKQGRFTGSTRYYRGRLVEALRRQPDSVMTLNEISALINDDEGATKDRAWMDGLVDGLVRDGLAVRDGDRLSLP
ncbi:MAG: A/G-specific adenine glycosylase [Dehalococcoidia bacterium]